MAFQDHFSAMADAYRDFRPTYPPALFTWLAAIAPGHDTAVDLGCGSGQASVALAACFAEVIAIDPSADQIARAVPHPRVRYVVAPAEATTLGAACADLVLAAQALHWFEPERLARELARIARSGAPFVAVAYALCRVAPEVDEVVDRLYLDLLGPYWPPERRHVDAGYRTLPFPWSELDAPSLELSEAWSLDRFVGYLGTWSAVGAYRRAHRDDPVASVLPALRRAWGGDDAERRVRWPLAIRTGRIAVGDRPR